MQPRCVRQMAGVVCLATLFVGCSGGGGGDDGPTGLAREFDSSVPTAWFAEALNLIRTTPGFSPPVASRALGYLGASFYESVYPGMPGYNSLSGRLNGLVVVTTDGVGAGQTLHWPTVANAALAAATRALFPNATSQGLAAIDTLEQQFLTGFQASLDPAVLSASIARGQSVAAQIIAWANNDGGQFGYQTNQSPGYVPPTGPGLWVPTPPNFAPALQAAWGQNRCFVLPSGDFCNPGPPPSYATDTASSFYQEALEVYTTTTNLLPDQVAIARFWADDPVATATPPGHWISILNQITERDAYDLEKSAEAYGRLGIALADAFISCWNCKYRYNLLRPITYIQQTIDQGWTPLLNTPPFPEYTSGHSVQSGAAATVLTSLFGEDFAFTDNTGFVIGEPARSFNSFWDAAEEAAISRLYGGIHFRSAIDLGIEQGRAIGHAVNALDLKAKNPGDSSPASAYPSNVANDWFDLARELIRTTPGFTPPVASRALGYAGVTLYETVAPGIPGSRSLAGQLSYLAPLPRIQDGLVYHWPSAANAALASISRRLWRTAPSVKQIEINNLEDRFAAEFRAVLTQAIYDRSVAFGQEVARVVDFWSRSDGGYEAFASNFPTNYVPPTGPGLWEPTLPAFQRALQPFWGDVRTFILPTSSACDPGPPPAYSTAPSSQFYLEALETYTTSNTLSQAQIDIANWWADGGNTFTPPGHSISIATTALRDTQSRLDRAATTYAKVGIAVADAFISCWEAKYTYNLLRPITYIRNEIDPNWLPLLATPPFPEFTSGHSVQSGAAAEVLTDIFGSSFFFYDQTNTGLLGLPARPYGSFFEAANEAAISRLYGGIHFRAAIDIGVQQGQCVGALVNALDFTAN